MLCVARKIFHMTKYEGRSIYKVSWAVVFLIFRNKKFQDIRFVGNLIYNISCKFHNSDINTVKSVILVSIAGVVKFPSAC